jgi:thiamine biosynthesis lipoprotein
MDRHFFEFYALGSDCSLQFVAPFRSVAEDAAVAVEREVARIETRYSRYRPDSELSRINNIASIGGSVDVDAETAGLIEYAYACFRRSDGLFDITSGLLRKAWNFHAGALPTEKIIAELLPRIGLNKIEWSNPRLTFGAAGMELDFGGIGKEYAADRAAQIASASGIEGGLVNLGGDVRVIGRGELPWTIGIRHPRRSDASIGTLELLSGGLATSGDYERFVEVEGRRYCHILDPRSGWPVQGLQSATVIGDDCLVAGSLATMAMLKGYEGSAWLRSLGVRHVVVDDGGRISGTEKMTANPTPLC